MRRFCSPTSSRFRTRSVSGLQFETGEGPRIERPVRSRSDVARLGVPDPNAELRYVMDAVRLIRRELNGRVPLIGFAGSPWTVGTYIVEGGSSREFSRIKAMMYEEPATLHSLLELLAESTRLYLNAQIEAGAQAVMIFDTWGGVLDAGVSIASSRCSYMQRIVEGLTREHEGRRVPVILFTKGGGAWLDAMAQTGCDALGVDWTTDLADARRAVQRQRRAAGQSRSELPICLTADDSRRRWRACSRATVAVMGTCSISATAFIPQSPPEHAGAMIAAVHELSPPYHAVDVRLKR